MDKIIKLIIIRVLLFTDLMVLWDLNILTGIVSQKHFFSKCSNQICDMYIYMYMTMWLKLFDLKNPKYPRGWECYAGIGLSFCLVTNCPSHNSCNYSFIFISFSQNLVGFNGNICSCAYMCVSHREGLQTEEWDNLQLKNF